jgi:hypothetical protein
VSARRRSISSTTARLAALSGAAFLVLWLLLSVQMAAGKDPALGPKAKELAAARSAPPVRRVVKRTVIVRRVETPGAPEPAPAAPAPAAPPAVSTLAPQTAPPVVAAPPAPVVTRTS